MVSLLPRDRTDPIPMANLAIGGDKTVVSSLEVKGMVFDLVSDPYKLP